MFSRAVASLDIGWTYRNVIGRVPLLLRRLLQETRRKNRYDTGARLNGRSLNTPLRKIREITATVPRLRVADLTFNIQQLFFREWLLYNLGNISFVVTSMTFHTIPWNKIVVDLSDSISRESLKRYAVEIYPRRLSSQ